MTSRHAVSPELRALIDEMLNGVISAEGINRLELALDDDRAAQQFFRDYCQLHINLDAETRAQRVVGDFKDRDRSAPAAPSVDVSRDAALVSDTALTSDASALQSSAHNLGFIAGCFQNGIDFLTRPAVLIVALAFGAIGALLFLAASMPVDSQPSTDSRLPEIADGSLPDADAQRVYIASVTNSHHARWIEPAVSAEGPARLFVGQRLKIEKGLIEIKFDLGAQVLIEGPAEFVLNSPMQATLAYGQLTAQVPEQAIGFTIQTPMVNVVDLGTEFGVRVSAKGMTDVAVFSGQVVAAPRDAGLGSDQSVKVLADQVRRFWSGSSIDQETLAAPEFKLSIPRQLPVQNASFELPRIEGLLDRNVLGWTIASRPTWGGRLNGGVQLFTPERVQLPVPPTGRQWGFIESRKAADGGVHHTSIHQAVGAIAPNTDYRLKIAIGREAYTTHGLRAEFPFSWEGQDGFEIGLWSGTDNESGPRQPLKNFHDPVPMLRPGQSEVVFLNYRTPSTLRPEDRVLYIRLAIVADDWCRVLFDDVKLEAVSVGEKWLRENRADQL